MKYQQLTEGLRYQIALLCEDKVRQAGIARRLGVSKSTVSRELRRNRSVDGYQPAVAQKLSTSRRKAAGKRRMHEDTVFFVEEAPGWLWSPEQISAVGKIIGNPRLTNKYANKLAKLQRRLSRKKSGSKNRAKARQKVARVHAKIADCRTDNLHKLSRKLINENQVVCAESLKVKNMIRNPHLAKQISDAGWGEFVRQLEYKAGWAGRTLVRIDQFFPSSKRCSDCGYTLTNCPLMCVTGGALNAAPTMIVTLMQHGILRTYLNRRKNR